MSFVWGDPKICFTNAFVFFQIEGTSKIYQKETIHWYQNLHQNTNLSFSISVDLLRLQDRCISTSMLMFYYCMSNNLPREKTVTQM